MPNTLCCWKTTSFGNRADPQNPVRSAGHHYLKMSSQLKWLLIPKTEQDLIYLSRTVHLGRKGIFDVWLISENDFRNYTQIKPNRLHRLLQLHFWLETLYPPDKVRSNEKPASIRIGPEVGSDGLQNRGDRFGSQFIPQ